MIERSENAVCLAAAVDDKGPSGCENGPQCFLSSAAMVMSRGARLLLAGIAVGLIASVIAARVMATQVWTVSTFEPVSLGTVSVLLLVAGLQACYWPAWRASTPSSRSGRSDRHDASWLSALHPAVAAGRAPSRIGPESSTSRTFRERVIDVNGFCRTTACSLPPAEPARCCTNPEM